MYPWYVNVSLRSSLKFVNEHKRSTLNAIGRIRKVILHEYARSALNAGGRVIKVILWYVNEYLRSSLKVVLWYVTEYARSALNAGGRD